MAILYYQLMGLFAAAAAIVCLVIMWQGGPEHEERCDVCERWPIEVTLRDGKRLCADCLAPPTREYWRQL